MYQGYLCERVITLQEYQAEYYRKHCPTVQQKSHEVCRTFLGSRDVGRSVTAPVVGQVRTTNGHSVKSVEPHFYFFLLGGGTGVRVYRNVNSSGLACQTLRQSHRSSRLWEEQRNCQQLRSAASRGTTSCRRRRASTSSPAASTSSWTRTAPRGPRRPGTSSTRRGAPRMWPRAESGLRDFGQQEDRHPIDVQCPVPYPRFMSWRTVCPIPCPMPCPIPLKGYGAPMVCHRPPLSGTQPCV